MTRRILLSGLGITVLLCGGLILIGPRASEAPVTEVPPEFVAESPAPARQTPPWAVAAVARQASPSREWKPTAVEPSGPGKADRGTRKAVRKALLAAPVSEELIRCVEHDREVWFGGASPPKEPAPRARPAMLILQLESAGDRVKITEARVKTWGGASQSAVACARDVLVGKVIPTGSRDPASSAQMTFLLSPRSSALATAR